MSIRYINTDSVKTFKRLSIATLGFPVLISTHVHANVLELTAGLETGRFIDGVNLSDNYPGAALAAEWSTAKGVFTSLSCFISEADQRNSIQRGCDLGLGMFVPLNENHALTFALGRHDYSSDVLSGWEYTDASISWHMSRKHLLKFSATDSLLGQNVAATSFSYQGSTSLNDRWSANFGLSLSALEESAKDVDSLKHLTIGVQHNRGRWTTELKFLIKSSDYRRFVKIDQSEPELALNIRYRIY